MSICRSRGVFDDDDDNWIEEDDNEESTKENKANEENNDDEIDPLDAFMQDINEQAKKEVEDSTKRDVVHKTKKIERLDELNDREEDDAEKQHQITESKYKAIEDDVEYDSDDNPIKPDKMIVPLLQPIDHSHIQYESVQKCFYKEHTDVKKIPIALIDEWMKQENIQISMPYGMEYLKPVWDFSLFGLTPKLSVAIKQFGYENPTPIQSTALPVILSGYDIISVAKTGSGKTFAYVWPMLEHIIPQRPFEEKEGPIGVVLAPTRELAEQIYKCIKPFSDIFNISSKCIVGGLSKWEQKKSLFHQPEIVVGTPGRLIDMIKMKATNMIRCSYIVLDEADRMFELGFEPQIRSIIGQIQPSRQTIMCSATFHKRVEILARDILTNPVRIVIGNIGQSNDDIDQEVYILRDENAKWGWLLSNILKFTEIGKVLIFVNTKENTERISENLNNHLGTKSESIHGDKIQYERNGIINRFKKGITNILVATDVAARGLDIDNVKVVINYDKPKNIETYVHRIGRTGRMNKDEGVVESGSAYTLLSDKDVTFACDLVYNFDKSNQRISKDLLNLANKNAKFRESWKSKNNFRMNNSMLYKPTVNNNNNNNTISPIKALSSSSLPSSVGYHKTNEERMNDFADLSGPASIRKEFASTFVKSFEILKESDKTKKSITIAPLESRIKCCTILPPKQPPTEPLITNTKSTTIKDDDEKLKSIDRSTSRKSNHKHHHRSHHHHSHSKSSSSSYSSSSPSTSRSRSRSRSKHHHNHNDKHSHSKHH